MQTIGYLGPEGSYSQIAAGIINPNAEKRAYDSFPLVFSSLLTGQCDCIVIPIENTLNGGVLQNMDLLQYTDGICAVKRCKVIIDHRLATVEGSSPEKVKRIYSHSQALGQCAKYLAENFPSARLIPVQSTSASLDMIKSEEDAGIVGAHTIKKGIKLSDCNVADEKSNFTYFLLVKRGEIPSDYRSQYIYFSVTLNNRSGALLEFLQCVAAHGINMTKIESRPIKNLPDEYRFFIETEGDYSDNKIKSALEDFKNAGLTFKLIGCY